MTAFVTSLSVAILLSWILYALISLAAGGIFVTVLSVILGVLCFVLFNDTIAIRGFIALLGPVGIVLPLLALRHMAGGLSVEFPSFSTVELLVFLILYMAFLATSMGVIPLEVYRLGFAPVPVGVMVLALCAYGALSGNLFVPILAVLGQAMWVMGWGSSNWFDHVTHAFLVPVVMVVLLLRLF